MATNICFAVQRLAVPVLAALDGTVAAAGCQLLASVDYVLATRTSKFALPAIKYGLFPATPAVPLSRAINSDKRLMETLLLGDSISAEEAHQLGLVNRLVNAINLKQEQWEVSKQVNCLDRDGINALKRSYYNSLTLN